MHRPITGFILRIESFYNVATKMDRIDQGPKLAYMVAYPCMNSRMGSLFSLYL
jgi:predicted ATPase